MTAPAVQETVEERARRLGLVSSSGAGETVEQRAHRLGLDAPAPTGHLGKPFVDAKPDDSEPGAFTKTMGVLAALNRDIPGAEAAQAGVRALVRREPYAQAREEIRGAEDAAPAAAMVPARLFGAGLSMAALPGGAIAKGAQFGGLSGALDSDPTLSKDERVGQGAAGAVVGGLAGAAASKAGSLASRAGSKIAGVGKQLGGRFATSLADLAESTGDNVLPAEVMRPGEPVVNIVGKRAIRPVVRLGGQSPDLTAKITDLLSQVGAKPLEGPFYGDAEEAMGLAPHQQPDLEDLLRRSVEATKQAPGYAGPSGTQATVPTLEDLLRQSITAKGGTPLEDAATAVSKPSPKPIASSSTRSTPIGTLPRNLKVFTDDELEQRWHSLAERLGREEAEHSAVQEAGYRGDYNELPRTEKFGLKGQEDLPDADGMVDAERLAADNKTVSAYNRRTVARAAQEKALQRIEAELNARGRGFSADVGVVPFGGLALAGSAAAAGRGR